jgi:hypothetical protein
MLFFSLSDWAVALIILAVIAGAAVAGVVLGRYLRKHSETLREPLGVAQGALLGVIALVLAFGLTLAVGRYEARRTAVVTEADAIGTSYLRAQLLAEPVRSRSLTLLQDYTDLALRMSDQLPGSPAMAQTITAENAIQRELWALVGQAVAAAPVATAPRLYVDSLNTTFDQQTVRVSELSNRVPTAVLAFELIGAAVAIGLLGFYLSLLGRGSVAVVLVAVLVALLVLITFDLDRSTRGLIRVPSAPLQSVRTSMELPPAASPPPAGR